VQARLGVALLEAGVGLRAGLGVAAKRVRGRISPDQESWIGAWRRRREWLAGYPPYERPEPPTAFTVLDGSSARGG
jgi:hypothetical protein